MDILTFQTWHIFTHFFPRTQNLLNHTAPCHLLHFLTNSFWTTWLIPSKYDERGRSQSLTSAGGQKRSLELFLLAKVFGRAQGCQVLFVLSCSCLPPSTRGTEDRGTDSALLCPYSRGGAALRDHPVEETRWHKTGQELQLLQLLRAKDTHRDREKPILQWLCCSRQSSPSDWSTVALGWGYPGILSPSWPTWTMTYHEKVGVFPEPLFNECFAVVGGVFLILMSYAEISTVPSFPLVCQRKGLRFSVCNFPCILQRIKNS